MSPTGATRVAAVIGDPIAHSLSPAIHNAAFAAAGLDWVFVAHRVWAGRGAGAVDAFRALGLGGMSVTMPHKESVIVALDDLTPMARRLDAVNCVFWDGERVVGDNTDGAGVVFALRDHLGITDLSLRGKLGAAKLVEVFAGDQPGVVPAPGWDNHRWIRFRTATAGLTGWLGTFVDGYRDPTSGGTAYVDLAGPGAAAPLPSYRPTRADRDLINQRTGTLLGLAEEWTVDDAMTGGTPRPRPQLRLVPGDGTAVGRAGLEPSTQGL